MAGTNKYIFTNMLKKAAKLGFVPGQTANARNWFRQKALNYRKPRIAQNRDRLMQNPVAMVEPGKMYTYLYDAKTKDTLPYWDAYPLIFAVEPVEGGFFGINLHYLPPVLRAKLMDALYTIVSDDKMDSGTKLNISYQTLKGAANLKLFQPCFKRYLFSQVRSDFILVEPSEWDIAMMLPTQSFQKQPDAVVWRDSVNKVRK